MDAQKQAELEQLYINQERLAAQHSVMVMKALLKGYLEVHQVDIESLRNKVKLINTELDGDEGKEGFQMLAALKQRVDNNELKTGQNAQRAQELQEALNEAIQSLGLRADQVEEEARKGRETLAAELQALKKSYEQHVAGALVKNNKQDGRLDDHEERIAALEAAKKLTEDRLHVLEQDNTANKSAIKQINTTLSAQAEALQQELKRAQEAEAALREEIKVERERTDGLVTNQKNFVTYAGAALAHTKGANAFCRGLWDEAGIVPPDDLEWPSNPAAA